MDWTAFIWSLLGGATAIGVLGIIKAVKEWRNDDDDTYIGGAL